MSGAICLVGGIFDLWGGLSILFQTHTGLSTTMRPGYLGYFLTSLGVVVLVTGALMFVPLMNRFTGLLMIIYDLIMLVLGGGMLSGTLNEVMQWSSFSGIVMLVLGVVMLYSGSSMSRKMM